MQVPLAGRVRAGLAGVADPSWLLNPAGAGLKLAASAISRRRLPVTRGRLDVPGLSATAEVIRDEWGVAHIYAETERDLFLAQAFVHCQDRFFQMELTRRVALGRLAELFGEAALDTDRLTRTLGLHLLGGSDLDELDADSRAAVEAYADGVNAWLESDARALPLELSLLRGSPARWEPEESLAIVRLMNWQLSTGWYGEIIRARAIEAAGAERAAELEHDFDAGVPLTLPEGLAFNRLGEDGRLAAATGPFLSRGGASNAWAISGSRTASGKPLLCNDPHLALSTPSRWYEAHLTGGRYEVAGITVPGVPGVVIGHNARIAWGITLSMSDNSDFYIERLVRRSKKRYEFAGGTREGTLRKEAIAVRGRAAPHIEEVLVTHHGPVVSEVIGHPAQRVSLCSMALSSPPSLPGFLALDRAQGWDEFVEAMRGLPGTPLNVVYADVDGNIGYWHAGRIPVRAQGDGSLPAPGWTGEHEWTGEVPFEESPHALNPESGIVITANHRIVDEDYPYELGRGWSNGFRAQRLNQRFDGERSITPEDCRDAQMDMLSIPAAHFAELIAGVELDDPDAIAAREMLRGWDGHMGPESAHAAVYSVARLTLLRQLLAPGLGEELATGVLGAGPHPVLVHLHEWHSHDAMLLLRMLESPASSWVVGAGGHRAWVERGLGDAIRWLRSHLGDDVAGWSWGRLHQATFPHPLSARAPLDRVFNPDPVPMGGDTDTPMQTAVAPEAPYDVIGWSTAYRQVIDLGDLGSSRSIHAPGQSGVLGSRHYADFIGPWHRGEYHPMLWRRGQVEVEAHDRLLLTPAG